MKKIAIVLLLHNSEIKGEQQNNEQLIREGLRREQPSNQIEREEQNLQNNNESSPEGLNREDINEDEKLERDAGTFEDNQNRSKKAKIRDVKAPDYGQGNVRDQPPKNEVEVEF